MRFASTSLMGSLRFAAQPARTVNNTTRLGLRNYSTESPKKNGNSLIFATLLGLGVAGGFYYNQSASVTTEHKSTEDKSTEPPKASFNPAEFKSFKLAEIHPINHDTSLFRFKLDSPTDVSGLHTASCVITRKPITKKDGSTGYIIRPYTPTSTEETQGYVDFVIKQYPTGKMSKHIHNLKVGDELEIKGPIPKYNWDEKPVKNLGMIAGGTGITPMLQVLRRVFDIDSKHKDTKVTLIFGNQTEEDILLKEELDGYAKKFPDRFKVIYALDRPPTEWEGIKGYVTKDDISKYLPAPSKESAIFVCGPDPLLATISGPKNPDKSQGEVGGYLKELGYDSSNVYKF